MFRPTHWATARVLQRNGCDVVIPQTQVCCGAIHFHGGASEPARKLADENLAAFNDPTLDAVILNVAGCGAMLKDYGHHWHDARQAERAALAGKVKDVHEFLDQLGLVPPTGPTSSSRRRTTTLATWVMRRKFAKRRAACLSQVPGLVLKELPESELCCGAAGTYNLTQPEMSARLSKRKLSRILETGSNGRAHRERRLSVADRSRSPATKATPVDRPSDGSVRPELSRRTTAALSRAGALSQLAFRVSVASPVFFVAHRSRQE